MRRNPSCLRGPTPFGAIPPGAQVAAYVSHHLGRLLDQEVPYCWRALKHFRVKDARYRFNGRTLLQWVRAGAMKHSFANRVQAAISGLDALGRSRAAVALEAEFTAWAACYDAFAASCGAAMPLRKAERKRFVVNTIGQLEGLLTLVITRIGTWASAENIELKPGPGLRDLLMELLGVDPKVIQKM